MNDSVVPQPSAAAPGVPCIRTGLMTAGRPAWLAVIFLGAAAAAALLVTVTGCSSVQGARKGADGAHVSAALFQVLTSAQLEVRAQHWPAVISKTNEAAADPRKTRYDQHVIDEWQGYAYAHIQNWPEAAKHLEATLDDGFLAPGDHQARLQLVTQCFFNAGVLTRRTDLAAGVRYLKIAIKYGTQAVKAGVGNDIVNTILINANYITEDYVSTARLQQAQVDSEVQQGIAPSAAQLDMLRSAYFKMNDQRSLFKAFKTSLTYHPTPELWAQAVSLIGPLASTQAVSTLHLYRLMLEINILKRPIDYTGFADTALRFGSPGEARTILEKGFADHVFPGQAGNANRALLDEAIARGAADQASLASIAQQAQARRNSAALEAAGLGYFSYRDYRKAAALLRQALAIGGLRKRTQADAGLLLGIAQWRTGESNAALESFGSVSGDPLLGPIADLWAVHVAPAAAFKSPPPQDPSDIRSLPLPAVTTI